MSELVICRNLTEEEKKGKAVSEEDNWKEEEVRKT